MKKPGKVFIALNISNSNDKFENEKITEKKSVQIVESVQYIYQKKKIQVLQAKLHLILTQRPEK